MFTPSTSPLHLPGKAFTIWTRNIISVPANVNQPVTEAKSRKISLPGKQFTIWTRSKTSPSPTPAVCFPEGKCSTTGNTAVNPWLSRAAWLAVPFMGALWYSDHQRQNSQIDNLAEDQLATEQLKGEFQNQSSSLSQELAQKTATLNSLQTKEQAVSMERDGIKAALNISQQTLKAKSAELDGALEKVKSLTNEISSVKSSFGTKEEAWNNSVAALKEEATRARQTLEQRELEMKDALVKVEAARAQALKEAAAAATKAQELAAELEALKKK